MGLLHRCALLCMWGGVLLAVGAAPFPEDIYGLSDDAKDMVKDSKEKFVRKERDLVPCSSDIKGYGLCDERFFTTTPVVNPDVLNSRVIIKTQQPGYYQHDITKIYQTPYQKLYQYPYFNVPTMPDNQQIYPSFISQNVITDQFVMIITEKNEHEKAAKNHSSSSNTARPENSLHTDASQPEDQTNTKEDSPQKEQTNNVQMIDFKELEEIFKNVGRISQNATNAILDAVYLQQKINKGNSAHGNSKDNSGTHLNRLKEIFIKLEKLAKNIKDIITSLIDTQIHVLSNYSNKSYEGKRPTENKDKPDDYPRSHQTLLNTNEMNSNNNVNDSQEGTDFIHKESNNRKMGTDSKKDTESVQDSTNISTPGEEDESKAKATVSDSSQDSSKTMTIWDEFDAIGEKINLLEKDLFKLIDKIRSSNTGTSSNGNNNDKVIPEIKNGGVNPEKKNDKKELASNNEDTLVEGGNSPVEDEIDVRDNSGRESRSHDKLQTPIEKTTKLSPNGTMETPAEGQVEKNELAKYIETLTEKLDQLPGEIKNIDSKAGEIPSDILNEDLGGLSNAGLVDRLIKRVHKLIKSNTDTSAVEDITTFLVGKEDQSLEKTIDKIINNSPSDDSPGKNSLREDLTDYKNTMEFLENKGIPTELIDTLTKKVVDLKELNITTILKYIAESTPEKSNIKKREVHNTEEIAHKYLGLHDLVIKKAQDGAPVHSNLNKNDGMLTSKRVTRNIFHAFRRFFRLGHILHKRAIETDSVKAAAQLKTLADLLSSIFDEEHANIYFNKVQELVKSGIEPADIYQETLRFVVHSLLSDIGRNFNTFNRHYNSNELRNLIENVLESNMSKPSVEAYNKQIDDVMLRTSVNPIHLMIDVTTQIFSVARKQLQKEGIDYSEKNAIVTRASDLLIRTFFRIVDDLFVWTFQSSTQLKAGSLNNNKD